MNFLQDVAKEIDNEYASLVSDGIAAGDFSENPMVFSSNMPGDVGGNAGQGLVYISMLPEPKVINLPPIYDKLYKKRKPTVVLPETTDIKHVSSVNIGNNYMRKTPKIHGIRL